MEKMEVLSGTKLDQNLADVLYLSSQDGIPLEIEQLLKQRKFSYRFYSLNRFFEIRDKLDSIGTAIIDANNASQDQVVRIIETLETKNICVILLTDKPKSSVGSFLMPPDKAEFALGADSKVSSIDDLEARINMNLAYRKKSPITKTKPAASPKKSQTVYKNKLAEQLNMTKSLADTLAEQLRLAGLVQQDFLPSKLPNTDRLQWATTFIPAEWVSGDIYDVARLDETHIGFYIADVVGHGMPAALLTIFLKQALVMRETDGSNYRIISPSEVMKNLNLRMSAQKLSGYQFATCCYCLLDTETLTLTYARAGHPYPIHIKKGNSQPEQLEVRGSLLGIFEQAEFPQQTIQLEAGDKIVLYSDGVDAYVGNFNNRSGFSYRREFLEISRMSVTDMMDAFNALIQAQEIKETEIDDITILGLEILQ
jgi:phosphoserine phosphatase RsbU/P